MRTGSALRKLAGFALLGATGLYWIGAVIIAGPRFAFLPIAFMFLIGAMLWLWRPRAAATFCVLPALILSALVLSVSGNWRDWGAQAIFGTAILAGAALLVATELWTSGKAVWGSERRFLFASLLVVTAAFIVDRTLTNQPRRSQLTMRVATSGELPFRADIAEQREGQRRVVLYRLGAGSACYHILYSNALAGRLEGIDGDVPVEIDNFHSFGRPAWFRIRSINGIVLNDGPQAAIPVILGGSGGTYSGDRPGKVSCN